MQIGEQLEIANNHVHCSFCGETIGDVSENFKQEMAIEQTDIEDAGPHYVDPSRFVDGQMEFRKFYCPDCGTMLFTETARVDDPVLDEFEVDTGGEV
jgi:acetone carboxylase gamma subunit